MPLVSELVTELKVKDSNFSSSMLKATAAVAAFSGVLYGAFKFVDSASGKIDEMAKAADRFGISADNFQALAYAARIGNTSIETLERSFNKLAISIDKSVNTEHHSADAFDRLHLSASKLQKLSLDQAYLVIQKALIGVTSETERLALANELFGKKGGENITFMKENIAGLMQEYKSLGLTVTAAQEQQADAFQDAKERASSLFGAFSEQIGAQLTPAFTEVVIGLTNAIKRIGDLREASRLMASGFLGSVKLMVDGLGVFLTSLDKIINGFDRLATRYQQQTQGVGRFFAGIAGQADQYKPTPVTRNPDSEMGLAVAKVSLLVDKADQRIWSRDTLSDLDKVPPKIRDLGDSAARASKKMKEAGDMLESFIASQHSGKINSEMDRLFKQGVEDRKTPFQNREVDFYLKEAYKSVTATDFSKADAGNVEKFLIRAQGIVDRVSSNRAVDTEGIQGVIKELRGYAQKQSAALPQQQTFTFIVKTEKGLAAELLAKPETKNYIMDAATKQARFIMAQEAAGVK